ncbi:SEC10/PgrA surface exclusion domain-containing protein [Enterococcus raffinosus]|uniref:SEC10/PgrA surface exclusion domain-containing protein n=1 Tax=Enterococcus raffinosus TaxID=71452 RepID=UPI001C101F75|nr:SEC10/PgrA surface exclusion domain-containing protein [Enterococcus raffinosus]MBU5362413.1 SEC10/PgrA surface exclusion domain-containing protein [Enterococcus raffinosus]
MKKQNIALFSATLATMVGFGLSNSTEVQADSNDTITQVNSSSAENSKVAMKQAIETAQSEVDIAQEAADTTQTQANAAKEASDASKAVADAAQNEETIAKEAVDKAQEAVSEAEKATPEKIEQAQNSVLEQEQANESIKEDIKKDQEAVESAESEVKTAQEAVNTEQKAVENAQTDLDKTQEKVDEKQQVVDEAQAIVNGDGAAEANENLDKAKEELEAAKNTEAEANTEADTAASAEESAQTNKDTAQTAANEANAAADAAAKTKQETEEDVKKTQSDLDKAKSEANADLNKIVVTQEYVNALKAYMADGSEANRERLLAADAAALKTNANFHSNEADQAIKINSQADMTMELLEELSIFAARLINSVRQEFGMKNVTVSLGSMKFADEIAKAYEADDWSGFSGHHNDAINQAAKNNGLLEYPDGNLYENLYSYTSSSMTSDSSWNLNKAELKRLIYNAMLKFLYGDSGSNWGHANSITGLMYENSTDECYFAVSFSKASYPSFSAHFGIVPVNYYIKDATKFDTEAIDIPDINDGDTQVKIEKLTQELADKKKAAETATNNLKAAQTMANEANQKLKAAETALEVEQADSQKTKDKLSAATEAVKTATTKVEKAQAIVDRFNSDVETNLRALEDAQKELVDAKAEEESQQRILDKAQEQLDKANENLVEANKTLITVKEKLAANEKLLVAGEAALSQRQAEVKDLEDASKTLSDAKIALEKAKAEYEAAQRKAESAKDAADHDVKNYESLKAEAEAAKKKLEAAIEKLKSLQNYLDLDEAIDSVKDQSNNQSNTGTPIIADESKGASKSQSQIINLKSSSKMRDREDKGIALATPIIKSSSILPQTGFSKNPKLSILGALLISLLGTLGFATIDKRDRRIIK